MSSVIVPNISLAKPLPGTFQNPGRANAQFRVTLNGAAGQSYEIQVSPDLKTWTPLTTVTNTSGVMQITDTIAANWPKKFYRALSK